MIEWLVLVLAVAFGVWFALVLVLVTAAGVWTVYRRRRRPLPGDAVTDLLRRRKVID